MKKITLTKAQRLHLLGIALLTIILGTIIFFVPPANPIIISITILMLISITFLTARVLTAEKKYQIIATVSAALFLIINYLVGFQVTNTILLLSFIIGVILLVRSK